MKEIIIKQLNEIRETIGNEINFHSNIGVKTNALSLRLSKLHKIYDRIEGAAELLAETE